MRSVVAIVLVGSIASIASAAAPAPGVEAITRVLTAAPGWAAFIETTQDLTPSERATRAGYRFFVRDGEVLGRTTAMAEGFNCEFKVRVRENGVELHPRSRACNERYTDDAPWTHLHYDPADTQYPFKRLNVPQKWWLSPRS